MSWFQRYRKYRQLVKEIVFTADELEYVESVIEDISPEFARLQKEYLEKRNIKLETQECTPSQPIAPDTAPVPRDKSRLDSKENKHFSKMYKMIAKQIHPDKLANQPRTPEVIEKEEMFKTATTAYRANDWPKFLEVAEKLTIRPLNLCGLLEEIPKETKKLKQKQQDLKATFGWQLYECNGDERCKEQVIAKAMKQIYNI
tara:strand:- start:838 stop:1440 length:603 start_codon:yes stop_codon:yes gene_type:complete